MEGERPSVVAESLPFDDHLRGRGGGERLGSRPPLEPAAIARDDPLDLRLLKHHLGDEDHVGIARATPREVASVLREPGEELRLHHPSLDGRSTIESPLYGFPVLLYNSMVSGNCYKVRLLLAHLGIGHERRELDVVDRSNRPDVLGGLNPDLRVPTLVLDDGRPLAESGAILWYFGEGTRFVPEDRYERAKVLQWMFFEQYTHEPAIAVARFLLSYSGEPERYATTIERRQHTGRKALEAMETHLEAAGSHLVGDSLTLADIALYAYTHVAHEGGFELEPYPALRAWLGRVAAEPSHVPIDA